jgi:hypothetical protein
MKPITKGGTTGFYIELGCEKKKETKDVYWQE